MGQLQLLHVVDGYGSVEGLLPLGLSKVLLDLNADGIVDVLAPGRLPDNPGMSERLFS